MPDAVTTVWRMVVITPESGGPAAPGLRITAHPMLTGGPGMAPLRRAELRDAGERDLRAFDLGRRRSLDGGVAPGLERERALGGHLHVARGVHLEVAPGLDRHLAGGLDGDVSVLVHLDGGVAEDHGELVVVEREGGA